MASISHPTQDFTDGTFTVSEFVYLLRNNQVPTISVDTAHRRNDPNAKYPNFNFATSGVDLSQYEVIWMFGYEGNNDGFDYGHPITDDEVAAITSFMDGGGGVFATGDHSGMGSYLCGRIPRVGSCASGLASQSTFLRDIRQRQLTMLD